MPVVTIYLHRLKDLLEKPVKDEEVIDALPYLGLDIEDAGEGVVKVEYNPNRPDFSTDVGVARALNGLLGAKTGTPRYNIMMGGTRIIVDQSVLGLRPHIVGLKARAVQFDEESVRQLISMQEDLHNGIGRKRRKVSIGIHNVDAVDPPFHYMGAPPSYMFAPLGHTAPMTMAEMLEKTEAGRAYKHLVESFASYPLLTDANGKVLSFPPIINGERTRVSTFTKNLFIDVTGTDLKAVGDALSILAAFLHDIGAKLETVIMEYPQTTYSSPNMTPYEMNVHREMANRLLGLNLSEEEIIACLGRCRITAAKRGTTLVAVIPRYRIDILHPVDMVEEVAIGYGIRNMTPTYPSTDLVGSTDKNIDLVGTVEEVLIGLGVIETVNLSLISEETVANTTGGRKKPGLRVDSPKSREHQVLRESLLPSLLTVLSKNIHEEYPQRIFEVGKVFQLDPKQSSRTHENLHVGVAIAHSEASFTEAKSMLTTLLKQAFNTECSTTHKPHSTFTAGRSAVVKVGSSAVGVIGEVRPEVLRDFQLRTPVGAFEINLRSLTKK